MRSATVVAQARRHLRGGLRAVRSDNALVARYLLNAQPRREHRRQPPGLSPAAAAVAAELVREGVVLTSAQQLVPEDTFDALARRADELQASPDLDVDAAKPFLTELMGSAPALTADDPLLQFALHPQVRGIAETYCRMRLGVQDVNIWVNRPVGGAPTQSQRWHRDLPEDFAIVKCFVYLSSVPDGAGPLQYAAGSNTRDGRRVSLPSEYDGVGHRLSDQDVVAAFGEKVVTARGDRGTVVFADTRGVHRGGFASTQDRVVAQITYASRASSRPRNLRPAPGTPAAALPDVRLARRASLTS